LSGHATHLVDDALAKRNTLLLAAAQALYSCGITTIFVTGSLIGLQLAPSEALSTMPITALVFGTALSTIPASMLGARYGRRAAFLIGATFGILSALLTLAAIVSRSFPLLLVAMSCFGVYQAFSLQYRFAATDCASPGYMPKAVSTVMFGSIAGSILGPLIVIATKDLFAPLEFAGSYAITAALGIVALVVLGQLRFPAHLHGEAARAAPPEPPLLDTLRQPRIMLAVLSGILSYGLMNLLMTGTPVAMLGCGFGVDDSAFVIQWHALAMFLPSFATGAIIASWGALRVIAVGVLLFAAAGIVGLSGIAFANFAVGLVLLGLAWNFSFIGATSLIAAESHKRLQAANDFAIFAVVALASLASGSLLATWGWAAINTIVAGAAVAWLALLLVHPALRTSPAGR
jgi:MFS family permease